MKNSYLLLLLLFFNYMFGQVGINTTTPAAQLEIKSSNQALPSNTDGIIIPKVDAFPIINPATAQNAMMVYLTTSVGINRPGFYYWNSPTNSWIIVNGGSLDDAYNFGGTGNGRAIYALVGAVEVLGDDGFTVTGTYDNGDAIGQAGLGTRMFFNPRTAAIRAGFVNGNQWDANNIGSYSVAFGNSSTATGMFSFAHGDRALASNINAMAFGELSVASGMHSVALGDRNIASGRSSSTFNSSNEATGSFSFASGIDNFSRSWGETVMGVFSSDYVPFDTTNFYPFDRLFSIGNGTFTGNRSNAFTILKNANTIIGGDNPSARFEIKSSNQATPNFTDGIIIPKVDAFPMTFPTPAQDAMMVYLTTTSGANPPGFYYWNQATISWKPVGGGSTLDQSYNFGGPGNGKLISAIDGAVHISGEDGLLVTGTFANGDNISVSGAGTRMFFNPRTGAFRSGFINGSQWDAANLGNLSVAMGGNVSAAGTSATSIGNGTVASGNFATAIGYVNTASGFSSTAIGGIANFATGEYTIVSGISNTAPSYGETTLGLYNTSYTPLSTNGFNLTDRLFTIGNGTGDTTRSNALTVLKNGNTGIGVSTPTNKLEVAGNVQINGIINNEAWISPTLQNGWGNFGAGHATAQYYKDKENRVHIKGTINNGTVNTVLFNLPVGYRPIDRVIFLVVSGSASGRVDIFANGDVTLISGVNSNVSLDTISFRSEQ